MIAEARVVIVGGGVGGVSIAVPPHQLGWHDVALVEANELTSGSTWHAAGLCTQFIQSYNLMRLLRTSVELYGAARDRRRASRSTFTAAVASASARPATGCTSSSTCAGSPRASACRSRSSRPSGALELFPLARPDGVLAAAYLPTDGHVDPTSLTNALAQGCDRRRSHDPPPHPRHGAHTRARRLDRDDLRGEVRARARRRSPRANGPARLARLAGVELPIVPLQHHYVMTTPCPRSRRARSSCRSSATRTTRSTRARRAGACSSGRSSATHCRGRSTGSPRASTASCCRRTSSRSRTASSRPPSAFLASARWGSRP